MGPAISTDQPLWAKPWARARHWWSVPPPRRREFSWSTRAIRGEDGIWKHSHINAKGTIGGVEYRIWEIGDEREIRMKIRIR